MAKDNRLFKIRSKTTGLFSTGGTSATFTTKGKTWTGMGPLKAHLRQYFKYKRKSEGGYEWRKLVNNIPTDWEVVEYIMAPTDTILDARSLYPDEINA
jgi:hypothetical protein